MSLGFVEHSPNSAAPTCAQEWVLSKDQKCVCTGVAEARQAQEREISEAGGDQQWSVYSVFQF